MSEERAQQLIESLRLEPHPEGGHYSETWRSRLQVTPADGRGARSALTTIYFLLPAGAVSRWHRVRSDETWIHIEGAPLELLKIPPTEWQFDSVRLGPLAAGQVPVASVPAGWWQAARSLGTYTLVCCTVGPGFDFEDFELMSDRPEIVAQLKATPDAGDAPRLA